MKKNVETVGFSLEQLVLMLVVLITLFGVRYYEVPITLAEQEYYRGPVSGDAFSYFRSIAISVLSVILLGITGLKLTNGRICMPKDRYNRLFLGFLAVVVAATLVSPFRELSLQGAVEIYENMYVLLAYLSICFSVSLMPIINRRQDFERIVSGLVLFAAVVSVITTLQGYGIEPFQWDWLVRMVVPRQYEVFPNLAGYEGAALGFFGNPNYVGSFFALTAPFGVHRYISRTSVSKWFYGVVVGLMFLGTLCAQSIGGLLVVPLAISGYALLRRDVPNRLFIELAGVLTVVGVFYGVTHRSVSFVYEVLAVVLFHLLLLGLVLLLLSRWGGKNQALGFAVVLAILFAGFVAAGVILHSTSGDETLRLDRVYVDTEGAVIFEYEGKFFRILRREGKTSVQDSRGLILGVQSNGNSIRIDREDLKEIELVQFSQQGLDLMTVKPFEITFFALDNGFKFINSGLAEDTIDENNLFGPKGLERLGSGRMYIWQAAIPRILKRPLLGYGPDTTASAFPQNDVVGKFNVQGNPYTVLNKPHNLYLQTALHLGFAGLALYLLLTWGTAYRLIRNTTTEIMAAAAAPIAIALVLYAFISIVNDSRVFVAPIHWIIVGMGISALRNEKQ